MTEKNPTTTDNTTNQLETGGAIVVNTAEAPTTVTSTENQEQKGLTHKGHERLSRFGGFLKRVSGGFMEKAKGFGGKIVKAWNGAGKLLKEGAAGVMSIDDLAVRGFKYGVRSVKEAYTSVKNAAKEKTTEAITGAREAIGGAYDGLKGKGQALIEGARTSVENLRKGALAMKTESALSSLARKYYEAADREDKAREQKEAFLKMIQEKQSLLATLHQLNTRRVSQESNLNEAVTA